MVDLPRRKIPLREVPARDGLVRERSQRGRRPRGEPPREASAHEALSRPTPPREAQLRDAIELFYFAYRSFTAEPDRILAEHGLARAHHRILYFVGRNPDIAINELLGVLAISKQALHAPLRKLLEGEWVYAQPGAQDRRLKRLRLTEAGRTLEARLTGMQTRHLGTVFSTAGDRAEEAWKSVMRATSARGKGFLKPASRT